MATGWKKIAEKWYYFDGEGAMKQAGSNTRRLGTYLDSQNGNM